MQQGVQTDNIQQCWELVGQPCCVRLQGALGSTSQAAFSIVITRQAAFSIKVCIMGADWKEVRSNWAWQTHSAI